MRERDRQSSRQYRNEVAELERQERESAERPIREAEAQLKKTHAELLAIEKENVSRFKDDELYITPELKTATMLQTDADVFNKKQADLFIQTTPEYAPYRTPENAEILVQYCHRNGLNIIDSDMYRAAFYRLRDLGLLTAIPEPEPIEEPEPEPIAETPAQTQGEEGFDLESGLPRVYTKREVAQMSSDQYRRAFRLYKDKLTVTNIGPGPGGRNADNF